MGNSDVSIQVLGQKQTAVCIVLNLNLILLVPGPGISLSKQYSICFDRYGKLMSDNIMIRFWPVVNLFSASCDLLFYRKKY